MNRRQYTQQRRDDWRRFERLVATLEAGAFRQLKPGEVSEFSRLFRRLCHDLSIIRSRAWGRGLISYLNHLVGRGHSSFYRSTPQGGRQFLRFVMTGFPCVFRRNIGFFLAACLLFFLPLAISWIVVQRDPTLANRVMSAAQLEMIDQMYGPRDEMMESQFKNADLRSGMMGFYVFNNVGIALRCFAQGILAGVGTVYTLVFNGIVLGTFSGYAVSRSEVHAEHFLECVVGHGSFELTAIAVAGGAGLMLGYAWIAPGQRTRLAALQHRGLEALQIAGGAAVMLFVAALIEAFWSPSDVPATVKYGVAVVLWLLVFLYLGLAGWRESSQDEEGR